MKKLLLIAAALFCGSLGLSAQTTNYQAILARIDAQTNFLQEGVSASVTMVTDKPGKDRSITKAKMFRRDHDKKFLILIEQPEAQKGEGYLQINDNLKFYDPNTRIFSHTSLKEKFNDSQALKCLCIHRGEIAFGVESATATKPTPPPQSPP